MKAGTLTMVSALTRLLPSTRWDYAGFSVFFERDRVIDAVAIGS